MGEYLIKRKPKKTIANELATTGSSSSSSSSTSSVNSSGTSTPIGGSDDRRKRSTSNEVRSVLGRNKLSIQTSDKGIKIVLTESYDLFHQDDVEHSGRHEI